MHRPRCVIYLCVILLSYAGGVAGQKQPFTFPDEPPQAPPLRPASLPQPASETLDNGMEVITVYSDEVPYVSVGWFLMAGAKYDPPDKAGLATLTADLLRQGTSDHTADQIASTLDFHAIRLEGSATHEYSKVSAHCLSQYTDLAVEVMAEVIRRPTFPKDEFRRRAKEMISGLSVQERDPGYQADRHLHEFIYKSHYEARPSEGTTKTLRSITVDDVIRFHGEHYLPNRSLLVFSGAIEPSRAVELAREHFGDWERGTPPEEPSVTLPPGSSTHVYVVDRPSAEQSQIRVGHIGIRRTDPDYVTSCVFNQIFGEGFNSRLNKRIRVEEGLTYGASGGVSAGKEPGIFWVSTFTRTEKTAEALRLILEEIRRARTQAPTPEELSESISYLTGQFGLSLETPMQVAAKVFELRLYGLADDYFEGYLAAVNGVTAEDVLEFADTRIHPDQLVVVVVGDADKIREELGAIAPVTVIEENGG